MGKETVLPKNIRQIGEVRGEEEKICLEDYVMTCIHKKEQQEKDGYLGIFLGERKEEENTTYRFIRGILQVPPQWTAEELPEKWKEQQEKYFPGWEVQGCCVIGLYKTERIREVRERIEGAGGFVYHLQEQEETLYAQQGGVYRKIKGYFVFYEQNRPMQAYLADEFKEDRVEKESFPDRAIKSFREKVRTKSENKNSNMLKMASSFFIVAVLAVAAAAVTRLDDLKEVQNAWKTSNPAAENEAQGQIYMDYGIGSYTDETTAVPGGTDTEGIILGLPENTAASNAAAQVSGGNKTASEGLMTGNSASLTQSNAATAATADSSAAVGNNALTANDVVSAGADASTSTPGDAASVSTDTAQSTAGDGTAADSSSVLGGNTPVSNENPAASENHPSAGADDTLAGAGASETADRNGTGSFPVSAQVRKTQATYTIRPGDTLADICSKYYGNLDKLELLCTANEISDANLIMPGQKIVLP